MAIIINDQSKFAKNAFFITEEFVWDFVRQEHYPSYFIGHIFAYLREHSELLEQEDYKKLYEETLDFQINQAVKYHGWNKSSVESNRKCIELLADINNDHKYEIFMPFTKEIVDKFLESRRCVWYSENM